MPETTPRRGRPKGTGIDDSQVLADIARLISTDPELRPTTAIKSLGISDPSVIRRLRDKYNQSGRRPLPPSAPPCSAGPEVRTQKSNRESKRPGGRNSPRPQVAAARTAPAHKRSSKPGASILERSNEPAQVQQKFETRANNLPEKQSYQINRFPTPQDVVATLYGLGLAATNRALEVQLSFADQVLRMPYFNIALRQQLAINAWAIGIVGVAQSAAKFRS